MPTSTAIAAGELRHLVTIAQASTTEDRFGGSDPSMAGATALATVYAKVEALTLRELYSGQQKISEVSHRVTMRYIGGVKAGMLLWFRGRQFQIQAIENPREINKLLILLCLERDDSAREEGTSELFAQGQGTLGAGSSQAPGQAGAAGIERHYPAGVIDGVNTTFVFSPAPSDPEGFFLIWNGLMMGPGDYTLTGVTLVTAGFTPRSGDSLYALY